MSGPVLSTLHVLITALQFYSPCVGEPAKTKLLAVVNSLVNGGIVELLSTHRDLKERLQFVG